MGLLGSWLKLEEHSGEPGRGEKAYSSFMSLMYICKGNKNWENNLTIYLLYFIKNIITIIFEVSHFPGSSEIL